MEAFEGVFTKRGESEASNGSITGAFEEVFVRRGRWSKNRAQPAQQHHGDVVNLAENIVSEVSTVEYPMPSLTDISNVNASENSADPLHPALIIKNTFVEAADPDFDSLQEFIQERKVKSCPASRQVSNATMLMSEIFGAGSHSAVGDEVLNTASSFGGASNMFAGPSATLGCFQSSQNDMMFKTSSTLMDTHFELTHRRIAEVVEDSDLASSETSAGETLDDACLDAASSSASTTEAALDKCEVSVEDRLNSMRTKGCAIQHSTTQSTLPAETLLQQQSPNQFFVSVQTPDGIVPGVVTLLGNPQQQPQQTQLCTPRLSEAPAVNANTTCSLAMNAMPLLPPPPLANPVLRLAEAIAPPELGGPELPSIGSLLHHKGECRPCTFFHTRGCENKEDCQFCHLCGPREKKKRTKALKAAQREAAFVALEQARTTLASWSAAEEQGFHVDTIVE
jgi:hypothetical protein